MNTTNSNTNSVIKMDSKGLSYLEKAMIDNIRKDNQETRTRVYQELLFSDLLLSLSEASPNQEKDNANINVAIYTTPQNVQFAVIFTSGQAVRRWRLEGGNFATIKGQDIYKLLESSPADVLVINPGSAPFIELTKIEFKQLAQGITPQSNTSPVKISMEPQAPKFAFPQDVFTQEQKNVMEKVISKYAEVEAGAYAGVLPPGASQENGWLRTLFVRLINIEQTQEKYEQFCSKIHEEISSHKENFNGIAFQCAPIYDSEFWLAANQNKTLFFDKNPPSPQNDSMQMEIGISDDVFNAEQKEETKKVLAQETTINSAVLGIVKPSKADTQQSGMKMLFLKVDGVPENNQAMQEFCKQVYTKITANSKIFTDTKFEVGIMPDPNFWAEMKKNNWVLFERN